MLKLILINFIILIIILLLFFVKFNNILDDNQKELTDHGWILYIIEDCPHCKTQLEDVPKFKNYIIFSKDGKIKSIPNILNSSENNIILNIEDIYSFPLWYNTKTNKKIYGVSDIKSILSIYAKNEE